MRNSEEKTVRVTALQQDSDQWMFGGKQKKSKREEQKEGKEVTAELCDAASSGFHHLTSVTILNHWSVRQFGWGCPVMDWFPECQFI